MRVLDSITAISSLLRWTHQKDNVFWWALQDSNLYSTDYESAALTIKLKAHIIEKLTVSLSITNFKEQLHQYFAVIANLSLV